MISDFFGHFKKNLPQLKINFNSLLIFEWTLNKKKVVYVLVTPAWLPDRIILQSACSILKYYYQIEVFVSLVP